MYIYIYLIIYIIIYIWISHECHDQSGFPTFQVSLVNHDDRGWVSYVSSSKIALQTSLCCLSPAPRASASTSRPPLPSAPVNGKSLSAHLWQMRKNTKAGRDTKAKQRYNKIKLKTK